MSRRKHKKAKYIQNWDKTHKVIVHDPTKFISAFPYVACHKAKFCKVGDTEVFLCGYYDLEHETKRIIHHLDLFVGLDSIWDNRISVSTDNQLVKDLVRKFRETYSNLFVYHVADNGICTPLAEEVCEIVKRGKKIGFGCFGGHGRTGWLYGYLLKEIEGLNGELLIQAIRQRYCSEAIEGYSQYDNLGLKEFFIPSQFQTGQYTKYAKDISDENEYYDWKTGDRKTAYEVELERQTEGNKRVICPVCCSSVFNQDHCEVCQDKGYITINE